MLRARDLIRQNMMGPQKALAPASTAVKPPAAPLKAPPAHNTKSWEGMAGGYQPGTPGDWTGAGLPVPATGAEALDHLVSAVGRSVAAGAITEKFNAASLPHAAAISFQCDVLTLKAGQQALIFSAINVQATDNAGVVSPDDSVLYTFVIDGAPAGHGTQLDSGSVNASSAQSITALVVGDGAPHSYGITATNGNGAHHVAAAAGAAFVQVVPF